MEDKMYMDWEAFKQQQLFMEYREKLLHMVGISPSKEIVDAADKYIYDNYEQYRKFIQL